MKLAKKMLASVIALAMVAALALTAFAANSTIIMSASKAVVGENVTITVSAKDMAGLEAAGFTFGYDAEALEFVSVAKAAGAAYDMGLGDKLEGKNEITWAWIYTEAATADSDLVVLTFKVLKAGSSDVTIAIDSWDGVGEPDATKVTVNAEAPTTAAPTTAPTTAAPTTAAPTEPTSADAENTTKGNIPQTGEAGVAAIAGVMALAAVAFVATRKKDEE